MIKYILIGTLMFLTGCGGGGGGGVAPAPTTINEPIVSEEPAPPSISNPTVINWENDEYNVNYGLSQIGASGAYLDGYSGAGVTVAVLDTGVDKNHFELTNNLLSGRSFVAYTYNEIDGNLYYVNGGISDTQVQSLSVSNLGGVYTTAPTITITGDGSGAEAIATLDVNGNIDGIYMTSNGSGYTFANVSVDETGTGGSGLVISDVILGAEDTDGHGTGVTGIIASEKNTWADTDINNGFSHGVAFNANILPVQVLSDDAGDSWTVNSGIVYATQNNARVLNLSLGTTSSFVSSSTVDVYRYALNNNSAFVIAAGNEGLNCLPVAGSLNNRCSFPAATPWLDGNSDLLTRDGGWIVVGAVDENNDMPWWNNKAGVTKSNYLVAPGVLVPTTDINDGGQLVSGTSIATPFVSGAMALMIEKYPHLKGREVADIFFQTATDLGDVGVDNIFGNGLINLDKAFSPIGELSVPTSTTIASSVSNTVANSSLVLPKAFGDRLLKTKSLTNVIAIDDYGRDFKINMSAGVGTTEQTFSFDSFTTINNDNLILGFDSYNKKFAIGTYINNKRILVSYENSLLGASGTGATNIGDGHTIYLGIQEHIPFSDNIKLKYDVLYSYAHSNGVENSLIKDISDIHSFGGEIDLMYDYLGISIKSPLAIYNGNMTITIPTSRNIDGSLNQESFTEDLSVDKRELRYGPFAEYKNKNLFARINFHHILNKNNFIEAKPENEVNFIVNYLF